MPDIFDEVEEDLRAERARQLWARFGGLAVGLLLLVIAGVAGWQGWRWYETRERQKSAAAYLTLERDVQAEGADLPAMAGRFEALAADSPAGYRTLALLRDAALLAETGNRDGALAVYDRIAADSAIDPLYRDYATLLWVLRSLDTGEPAVLAQRIAPIARPDAPWSGSARELQALIQLRAGQRAEARQALQALSNDVTVPQGIRERAGRIAQGISG